MQFRLAARTDAAGKYNPNAPLEGNEDNMFVDCYLDDEKQGVFRGDEVVELADKGCIMVVADGMGGMNAGEVASDIAIKTVERYFEPSKLTDKVYKDSKSRIHYMEEVVVAADAAIKADSSNNPEHEGMGSTIILAWLCDGEICLTWCGDSRAYLFRPGKGLWQVSKDHSYVQGLIDSGKITEMEAFDHPYGNIVTRSLGDPERKAKPESRCFKVYQDDIFLLCSDGLSGVLRDRKTFKDEQRIDTENLEDIISENRESMAECRDRLFEAAQRNDWYDNVTAILCEIVRGEKGPIGQTEMEQNHKSDTSEAFMDLDDSLSFDQEKKPKLLAILVSIAVLCFVGILVYWLFSGGKEKNLYIECLKAQDTTVCNNYITQYPNGKYLDEIRTLKNNLIDRNKQADHLDTSTTVLDNTSEAHPYKSDKTNEPPKSSNGKQISDDNSRNEGINNDVEKERIGLQDTNVDVPQPIEKPSNVSGQGGLVEDNGMVQEVGGLVEDPTHKPTQLDKPTTNKTSEDLAYDKCLENGGNLINCMEYLKNYKDGKHRQTVMGIFSRLYRTKIDTDLNNCKTLNDIDRVEKEHNSIMDQVGLKKSQLDDLIKREKIEKRKNELNSSASSNRPQAGAHSPTAPKSVKPKK